MRYFRQIITDGYHDFLKTKEGVAIDVTLQYEDSEREEYVSVPIKCDVVELPGILEERLSEIGNKNDENPEFLQDILEVCADIKKVCSENKTYSDGLDYCEITANLLTHPVNLAEKKWDDDMSCYCVQCKEYLDDKRTDSKKRNDYLNFYIELKEFKIKSAFICKPDECELFLADALNDIKDRLQYKQAAYKLDEAKIRDFMISAREPFAAKDFNGLTVSIKNPAIKHSLNKQADLTDWMYKQEAPQKFNLEDVDMIFNKEDGSLKTMHHTSCDSFTNGCNLLDDDMLTTLKRTKEDIMDEMEDDAPYNPYSDYEDDLDDESDKYMKM